MEEKTCVGEAKMLFPKIICYGSIFQSSGEDTDNKKTPRFSSA